jgi:acyl-CoA synthetase (AMP-forming)/AMP-acid ligase II
MIFSFLQHDQDKTAFELGNGDSITYGEFEQRLQAYIQYLQQQPIQQGERIILWLPNDLSLILGYYACLYLGLIAVPAFAENTPEEIEKIQQVTGATYALTTPSIKQKLTNTLKILDITHISNNIRDMTLTDPQWPEHTGAILFMTSGSTGTPKAVAYTHKTLNWASRIYQQALQLSADDRLLTTLDLYGNAGFTFQILPLLNIGATIQLLPEQTGKAVYQAIEQGTTILCMIPYLGMKLLDYATDKPLLKNKLRYIVVGGDRIPDRIFTDFPKYFNAYPNQGIGMSETNIYAINLHHQTDKPGSAGTIMPHTKVKIVSSDGTAQAVNDMGGNLGQYANAL